MAWIDAYICGVTTVTKNARIRNMGDGFFLKMSHAKAIRHKALPFYSFYC